MLGSNISHSSNQILRPSHRSFHFLERWKGTLLLLGGLPFLRSGIIIARFFSTVNSWVLIILIFLTFFDKKRTRNQSVPGKISYDAGRQRIRGPLFPRYPHAAELIWMAVHYYGTISHLCQYNFYFFVMLSQKFQLHHTLKEWQDFLFRPYIPISRSSYP